MPNKNMPIDLGKSMGEHNMNMPSVKMDMPEGEDKIYPTLYLEWEKPYNLPDGEFTMTVRARKLRSTEDHKNEKYNEDVEILSIEKVEGGKKVKATKRDQYEDAGDALDKIKEGMDSEE